MYKDETKKFDIRVVEKYIQDGVITPAEYSDSINSLPDMSRNIDKSYELTFSTVYRKAAGKVCLTENKEDSSSSNKSENVCSSEGEKSDD